MKGKTGPVLQSAAVLVGPFVREGRKKPPQDGQAISHVQNYPIEAHLFHDRRLAGKILGHFLQQVRGDFFAHPARAAFEGGLTGDTRTHVELHRHIPSDLHRSLGAVKVNGLGQIGEPTLAVRGVYVKAAGDA